MAYVRMRSEEFEESNFSQGVFGIPFIVGIGANSLDGDFNLSDGVVGGADNSEGSLAQDATVLQHIATVDGEGVAIHHSGDGIGCGGGRGGRGA